MKKLIYSKDKIIAYITFGKKKCKWNLSHTNYLNPEDLKVIYIPCIENNIRILLLNSSNILEV